MTTELVRLAGVNRFYPNKFGTVAALQSVFCHIDRGEQIAITGPSGSGKTTLLAVIAGLERADAGTISWPELRLPLRPGQIGVSFQAQSLLPSLTIAENIAIPLLVAAEPEPHATRIAEALALVGLDNFGNRYPDELSGGQSQRVALARAMITRPPLLLADEPTGRLDQATGKATVTMLINWAKSRDISLVIATHDLSITNLFERNWRMNHGVLTVSSQ